MPRRNEWFTPRLSGNGAQCVETFVTPGAVHVRNSKDRDGGIVTFTHDEWHAFIESVRLCDDYDVKG